MKLILEIELGNDALQTGSDLADLLIKEANRNFLGYGVEVSGRDGGKIMDSNGNGVGKWEIKP